MYKLIRFYNQNRKQIWKIIGIILVIILILQLLNYSARQKARNQNSDVNNTNDANIVQYNELDLSTNKSVVSGETISQQKQDTIKTIDNFFLYCNEQKLQEAYDLLTEECKTEMYPSIEVFEEMYYQKVLNGKKKNISVENWTGNTYKITINDDFISSGKYSEANKIQDYITIQDNQLNINGYIRRVTPKSEKSKDDITIKVMREDIYMDYVLYTYEITNDSQRTILLDSLEAIDSMYIQDSKGTKYPAYSHELSKGSLLCDVGEKKQVTIKYYSKYTSTKRIKKIVFSKLILEYNQDANNYYNTFEIEI